MVLFLLSEEIEIFTGINKKTTYSKLCLFIEITPQHEGGCFLAVALTEPSVLLFPIYKPRDRNTALSCLADAMVTSIKENERRLQKETRNWAKAMNLAGESSMYTEAK